MKLRELIRILLQRRVKMMPDLIQVTINYDQELANPNQAGCYRLGELSILKSKQCVD